MDSYQIFVQMFREAVNKRDFFNLTSILEDGRRYFQFVSNEHHESIVCSVFDRSSGLLCFLNDAVNKDTQNKHLDNALTKAFHFLQFFIENFHTVPCFVQYIIQIKDVCELALYKQCSFNIKKEACYTFQILIDAFRERNLNYVQTIQKFVRIFYATQKKEIKDRKWMFHVLGKIIKRYRDIRLSPEYLDCIFNTLRNDAKQEFVVQYSAHDHIASNDSHVYFDVFADILDSIEPRNELYFRDFYEWIKTICRPNTRQPARIVIASAIDLLSRHMSYFQDFLYSDSDYWCNVFWQLSREGGVYKKKPEEIEKNLDVSAQCALKKFYEIIGQMLVDQNREDSRAKVLYLSEDLYEKLRNVKPDLLTLKLSIYGFTQLAASFKIHSCNDFDIKQMYSHIANRALSIVTSEQNDEIQKVCCYQNMLCEMSHMFDMTIEKVNVLIKLSIYIIKRFPDLMVSDNKFAVSSLIKTISRLEWKSLLQLYLDNIVHDGIIWSCSHTLALDAELQQDLQQPPICYKNYLPLWTELLNTEAYRVMNEPREQRARQVADTLMDICLKLINRLDIRIKRTNENVALSELAFTYSAVNQTDFRVFVNLVDLYVDVVNASDPSLFANTIHNFLFDIVKLSCKHPLIPGFYKLIRAGMRIVVYMSEVANKKEREERHTSGALQQTEELLSNYLIYILDLIPTFSNELLIVCLYLILDARFAYIEDALPHALPAFKIAFTIGLSNLELAHAALVTLETWKQEQTDKRTLKRINLREIVPYLEPYLRSTESSIEMLQDLTKAAATRKHVKRVNVIDTECTLHNFQRRVLLFLGSLDYDLLVNFVHERAARSTGASWDRKNLIKYTLPLPDAQPDIFFDRILPRIIALARDSSDRRIRIAACEVLHSMVTIVVGLTARHLSDPENRFVALYGPLCSTLLALGCDSDQVVCELFRPLTLQLMRWCSRIVQQRREMRSLGEQIVNSLFDSLTDDSNPALREFSGKCLAELTDWLIRETDENMIQFNMIIQRINDFALHPSKRKRIAAATAFNHLYLVLSRDNDIISIYWLEIFYCFVRSLDGCDNLSIMNALTYIEKEMKCKADILNEAEPGRRRKPHEFDDATLIHALYWLLLQCGTVNEHCRAKCMELYVSISQSISGSAQETTRGFVKTYGIERLNDIVLNSIKTSAMDISEASNITSLLQALDCYIWLIGKQLLSVEELFPTTREHLIFSHIHSFVHQFWQLIKANKENETRSRKVEHQQTKLQCKTLITMFNFLRELLTVNVNVLPELLWDNALSALTIKCIMHPRIVGFDIKNIEMMDKLPRVLENLLRSMKSRYADTLPENFKMQLAGCMHDYVAELVDLHGIARNGTWDESNQHVNGLIMLVRCDVLDVSFLEASILANRESTIKQIFEFLASERDGERICINLTGSMIEYLRILMEFQLSQYKVSIVVPEDVRSMTEILVKLILDNAQVINIDSARIMHGEHFLNTFKGTIYKYMLIHIDAITFMFDTVSHDNPIFLLKWIEDMLLFLRRHKDELQDYVEAAVDAILRQFACLEAAVDNIDSRKERLTKIYGIVVRLKSKPMEIDQVSPELYQRIFDQLTGDGDIEFKTRILREFFICFVDMSDNNKGRDKDLQLILQTLKNDARSLCSSLQSTTDVNAIKVIDCFETLLILLPTTATNKSIVLLEYVMRFVASYGDCLFNDKLRTCLRMYYQNASSDQVYKTYCMFMKDSLETERLILLRGFLLQALEFCDVITVEKFFELAINELYVRANEHLTVADDDVNDANLKFKIVSKIGCFQLMTIMFAKIDIDKIIGVNNTIAQKVQDLWGQERDQIGTNFFTSLLKAIRTMRDLNIMSRYNELKRLLYCSAYNCLLAMIRAKNEEDYYAWAFGENSLDNRYIWKNIIDCGKYYNFGQVFKGYAKPREVTVNIRSTIDRDERAIPGHTYTYSYNLSGSTLNEDINAYDLNKCVILPYGSSAIDTSTDSGSRVTETIALESGDFNEHECMSYICVFLRHVSKNSNSSVKPKWLQCFCDALKHTQFNIRLFILKIISNTADEVFKPYAKFMLMPIIQATINYLERRAVNYIIVDILEVLTSWHDVALPTGDRDRADAQRLFEIFLEKVVTLVQDNNEYNYNLILKTIIEKWRNCLQVPISILNNTMTSARKCALQLILVFFENGMAENMIMRDDIVNFLIRRASDWKENDKEALLSCKCLGLYLKSLDNNDSNESEKETRRRETRNRIFKILGGVEQPYRSIAKQIKRITTLCQAYPQIAVDYIDVLISAMGKEIERPHCLEIFTLSMENLSAQDFMNNLRRLELQSMLANRTPFCEEAGLKIIRSAVNIISPADQLAYVNLAISYIKSSHRERRGLVYDILMNVYKRYSADLVTDDANVQSLLSISKQYLISGLLDPSQDLQERILTFWTEETDLRTEKSKELLLALLQKLSSGTMTKMISEDAFASFMVLLMLRLATKSTGYSKNIFDSPLCATSYCTFQDYSISVSWRRQNLSSTTPMFVDSLASQISSFTYCQSIDNSLNDSYTSASSYLQSLQNASLKLPQNLQSEAIDDSDITRMIDANTTFDISLSDADRIALSANRPLQSTPSHKRRFRRSEAISSDANRLKQMQKNMQEKKMIKQETIRQRNSIKLYRDYKDGYYPDIEIRHSSLIKPLLQLIKLDRIICKNMSVSLFCSLVEEEKTDKFQDFRQNVVNNLKRILQESDERNSSFNAIILETLLQLNVTDCNPQDIVRVSKANSLNIIGVLLLEQSLLPQNNDDTNDISSASSSKRIRRQDNEFAKWTQLASLYKSLNDVDVVLSIFRERPFFGENMQKAALWEVNGNWIQMESAFETAHEQCMISSMKEHCLQGQFEAVNNLCNWSKINELVKKHTNNDLNNIWNDVCRDWMLPYVCDAYVHMRVEKCWPTKSTDLKVIESWMCDPDKRKHLKSMLGENLVMFLLSNQTQSPEELSNASKLLNDLLDEAREQWVSLNPLCTELGIRKLQRLQAMNDLDALLKVFQCTNETDYIAAMTMLLDFWSTKTPTIRDNLAHWHKLADYRSKSAEQFDKSLQSFVSILEEGMGIDDDDDDDDEIDRINRRKCAIRDRMRQINIQLRLDIAEAALYQKHRYIAENHLKYLKSIPNLNLPAQVVLLEAKIECLCAELDMETDMKVSYYITSWNRSHRLLQKSDLDIDTSIAVRKHISALALKIESLIEKHKENQSFSDMWMKNRTISRNIEIMELTGIDLSNLNQIKDQLLQHSLSNLGSCEREADNIGELYYTLARHCYVKLTNSDAQNGEIFQKFLLFTLKSMYHDYLEAAHYFPCLLRPEQFEQNAQTQEIFIEECSKLQPWLFLRWRDLLFSHLATSSIASTIAPIVEKLAESYPDAIVYTYYLTIERHPNIFQNASTQQIDLLLRDKTVEYKRFLEAIQYVAQPELYLKYYLNELVNELSGMGKATATVESLLEKIHFIFNRQTIRGSNPRPGDNYNKLAIYENDIRALDINNCGTVREKIRKIKTLLNKLQSSFYATENRTRRTEKNKNKLKHYSPFLHEYAASGIEVPGQYTGDREPTLRYHVKIARFESDVIVMRSLRKPIRIGIIGDNGREYKFLVKFGEDLTIDQGLQQLYATMNRTLRNDASCRQRRLIIDTYEVIPLSKSFGLIQWIEDTKSLEDLVQFTLTDKEQKECKNVQAMYAKWIEDAAVSSRHQLDEQYKKALVKYNQSTVTNRMKAFIDKTPQRALREAFAALSPTWECFVTLRRNFVASYATMCAAHWLAGVGDRHLQNILVQVTTGRCLGIDFGHAFGSGIRAPIPELVPFRLTPQILQLLRPFGERDLLATIMTYVLRALREDCGPILACMDIFIHKPNIRQTLSVNDDGKTDADLMWSSKRNIKIIAKKLNGIHPSFITLEQLPKTHNEYFPRYRAIVNGNDGSEEARANKGDYLTPAEQVDCLLDQAKDLNVLGRMYANWQPWL